MQEGEKTLGVWLPLALADILNLLIIVSRRAGGETGQIEPLSRSELIKSWSLPVMAKAIEEDEEEAKAFALLRSVQELAEK